MNRMLKVGVIEIERIKGRAAEEPHFLRSFIQPLIMVIVLSIVLWWICQPIHEFFHWLVCKILGGDGSIHLFYEPFGSQDYFLITRDASFPLPVCFAGGIGTALILFSILLLAVKKNLRLRYILPITIVFGSELFIGISEGVTLGILKW